MPHWPRMATEPRSSLIVHFAVFSRGLMATIQDAAPTDVVAVGATGGRKVMRFVGPLAVLAALLSALATFMVLAGLTPLPESRHVVLSLLGVNAGAVVFLLGIILFEIWPVVQGRRRGRAGARLHV